MSKKHKRTSPYEDVLALGGPVKPPKLRKPAHSESPNRLVDASRTPLTSPQANEAAAKRMSIEVLEQKKMLLPYLDKIEYINVQLRQRGLLPETETPVLTSSWQTNSKERGSQDASNNAVDRKPGHVLASSPVRSRNQEPHTPSDKEHRTQMSVTTDKLHVRYPRLCATIDAPTLRQSAPRARPINWLLRLIESIYDELTNNFVLGSKGTTPNRPEQTSSRSTESTERAFRQRLVMPFLVRQFLDQTLGLPSLADQECLDLMGNVEATLESFPQMPVFSLFLREFYDDDILLFYLFLRHLAQQSFDLQLRAKEKLAHSSGSGGAKKFIAGDMYSLVDHPLVPDGTKIVILSRAACELVFQRFFIHAVDLRRPDGKVTPASTLARFMTEVKMHSLFDSSAFGKDRVSLDVFLSWGIQAFREIPEDVIAQFKYNDDA
ncbi:hypothetical protein Poli38472_011254 [Pythium oligandrum]|uniref:Uncharacterized protein n=1 Tax=Pythium oligandrum TaxID=41045 RepID=A0A8K1FNS7_PYTOL|nr:hypothetical protein Poli38472_011254 [Pythium oligandrum]|eukprot:TMW67634.1 hypothetical protein Poli38472_011254 [Pythium oligandrum]